MERAAFDRMGEGWSRAEAFGLVRFERPCLRVPFARPVWSSATYPFVLDVEPRKGGLAGDRFDLGSLRQFATMITQGKRDHLLLCDGLRTIRLDAPRGAFSDGPFVPGYRFEGLIAADPKIVALRRLLALCRTGRFSESLHRREPRSRRWILLLRTFDALSYGASQREIAEALLSSSVIDPGWRTRESSVRSQAQRLVRTARALACGGYKSFLTPPRLSENG